MLPELQWVCSIGAHIQTARSQLAAYATANATVRSQQTSLNQLAPAWLLDTRRRRLAADAFTVLQPRILQEELAGKLRELRAQGRTAPGSPVSGSSSGNIRLEPKGTFFTCGVYLRVLGVISASTNALGLYAPLEWPAKMRCHQQQADQPLKAVQLSWVIGIRTQADRYEPWYAQRVDYPLAKGRNPDGAASGRLMRANNQLIALGQETALGGPAVYTFPPNKPITDIASWEELLMDDKLELIVHLLPTQTFSYHRQLNIAILVINYYFILIDILTTISELCGRSSYARHCPKHGWASRPCCLPSTLRCSQLQLGMWMC